MTNKEIIEKVAPMLGDAFIIKDILMVNHKPHPYVIGPKHIRNNILTPDEIRRLEKDGAHCYHPGCTASYDQHTSETGMFVSLTRNLSNREAHDLIKPAVEFLESQGMAGLCFVDTPEKYRIAPAEKEGV